ncbi:MAG: hypothetical protein LQ337_003984 [Flavoplaca oasis]|nr:MAG: hypothetical protein LQ337_003984 [Flavoplaca oasis]
MPDIVLVFRIRGIAKPPETKQPASSPNMQADAANASPAEASGRKSRFDATEKNRPQALKPMTPAEGPSLGIEAFRTALYQSISSIADVANKQMRCDSLTEDEQQVVKERARWSKYADTFPTIGEDQARSLRALQQARNQSQSQINEAKKQSEEAINTIVKIIFATSIGTSRMPVKADITVDSTATKSSGEVINLKEEIASLRLQYSRNQERHDQELSEIRTQLERRVNAVESNLGEKLAQESARVRKLTEVNTKLEGKLDRESACIKKLTENKTEQESIKAGLETLTASRLDKLKTEMQSEVEKQSTAISRSFEKDSNELQSKTIALIRSEFKPELDNLKTTVSTINGTITDLKPEVAELSQSICSIAEYHNAIKVPLQNTARGLQSQEEAVKQVSRRQEEQDSTLQQMNDKISQIRDDMDQSHLAVRMEELKTEQNSLKAQTDKTEKICEQLREQQQSSSVKHHGDQPPSTVPEAQVVPLAQRLSRIDENIKKLDARLGAKQTAEENRDAVVSQEIGQTWNFVLELEGSIKNQAQEMDKNQNSESQRFATLEQVVHDIKKVTSDYQAQVDKYALSTTMDQLATRVEVLSNAANDKAVSLPNETLQQIDQLSTDHAFTSTAIQQIKAEIGTLNERFASLSDTAIPPNQPWLASSPQVNGITKHVEVQPKKIEALESKVDTFETHVSDKVKAMESTLSVYSSRFNNITTEPLVMSCINTLNQLYPLQPLQINQTHLRQELNNLVQRQDEAESRLKQQILDLKQELIQAKQELSNLAQTQRVAHHTYEHLIHRLKGEREEILKSIAGIQDLVKSTVRNGDEEPSKRDLGMEELRRRLDGVASTAEQQRKNLERVKNDFYKAQAKTHAKTNDLSQDVQNQTGKIDVLEKKIDTQAKDQARGIDQLKSEARGFRYSVVASRKTIEGEILKNNQNIDELKQEVHGFKQTIIVSKEDIERNIDALKTSLNSQAEDQRKLEKKVNSQYQDAKGYMQDAVAEVSKIDLRLEDLERTNPSFKGVNNHANNIQNDTVPGDEVVDIVSDSDEPVKPTSKRSRESMSMERPPQKRKRTKRDDDDSDEGYSEYSSPRVLVETRKSVRQASQQSNSPSRPKRGRPVKAKPD